MRIVINGLFLVPNRVGGSETYIRGLVDGLATADSDNDYILCLGPEAASTFRPQNRRWRIVPSPAASARRPLRLILEQFWLPTAAGAARADLIHSPGYTAPLVSAQWRVTSILDMNYRRHPEDLTPAERVAYSILVPRVAQRSHQIVTLTESGRTDVIRMTGVSPGKVTAIPLASRAYWPGDPSYDVARLAAIGVTAPFVLSVAAAYPHKNLMRLIQAFPLGKNHAATVQLVVVGLGGRALPSVKAAAERTGGLVRFLGWVDDATLASLYRCAVALAFPSLYEGFGLPILESMTHGTPVLTSNRGAMAEVADAAAELVDPYDVDAIREGLRRLVHDEHRRTELRRLGKHRAAQFSWSRTAEATLAVYRRAVAVS
jgi:glycosyltransferase involved in cell wall biosynthesis